MGTGTDMNASVQLLLEGQIPNLHGIPADEGSTHCGAHHLLDLSISVPQSNQRIDPLTMDVLPFPAEMDGPR